MKLRYTFDIMDMGDEICAVPVGEGSESFHGIIQLDADSLNFFNAIRDSKTPEEALEIIKKAYPDESIDTLGEKLCEFINQLIQEGILDPD